MLSAFEGIFQDARYGLRWLARNPAFSLTAILAGALGIGATTAVFSAVDRILFRALPYVDEERLVSAGMMAPLDTNEFLFAAPYIDLLHNPGPFEQVSAFQAGSFDIDLNETNPVRLHALRVQANFLSMLGFLPTAGRGFTADEDRPHGANVVMISHALWRSRFAADPRAVGRTLVLDGAPYEIVGVLPANFETPTLATADVLMPLALDEANEREGRAFRVFAKLKPGVSIRQAVAELQPLYQRAILTVPARFRKEISFRVRPVRDRQVGDVRTASAALLGAVLAVLLIACANIATLLLARAVARERELAVRAVLGASRLRLARQTLTESLLLSGIAGGAGCGLAWLLLRVFVAIAPNALPRLGQAAIDGRVLLFTVGASLASGLAFGIAPALRSGRFAAAGGSRATVRTRGGLRSMLVTLEIAFSMVLLTGAGLLLHSLWTLEAAPLGISTDHVVIARFVLGRQGYGRPEQQVAFFNELEQRLRAAPGVEAAAITDSIPPSGGMHGRPYSTIDVEGRLPLPEGTGGMVGFRYVTPGYFAALGIPIMRGRGFQEQDQDAPGTVVILSQSLAKRMFPGEDPVGKRILSDGQGHWATVVGMARDVTNLGATRESWPEFYRLRKHAVDGILRQQEPPLGWRGAMVAVRTAIDPKLAASAIRSVLGSLDGTLPVEMESMHQRIQEIDQRPRFYAILLTVFAAMGVLIAAVGLFGVMSFLVAQRSREVGVRIALGATPADIVRMTLASAVRWTAAGVALGAAGSLATARVLESLLYHVKPSDPGPVAAAVAVLCAVTLIAAAAPARRAARVDPMDTLRTE